jgi:uncharacterized NAD(P)/FAD-binding protein YdhS
MAADRRARVVGRRHHLAVVGLGPRGLSVVERLCANAPSFLGDGDMLTVHIVDPQVRDGGRVWRSTQDGVLQMNTVTSQVTMFLDESVDCAGPVVPGPSLYEWAQSVVLAGALPDLPDSVRAEAARLGPDSYPSRAFYGRYLQWTLHRLMATAGPAIEFSLHPSAAEDLRDEPDGTQRLVLGNGEAIGGLHAVVLALGHLPHELSESESALRRFADRHRLRYVPPGNPADVSTEDIRPGEWVIVRGMGLNFFDFMALLTIGRGGRFVREPDGRLRYLPSGREPRLVTGSRRGVPYHARGENQKGAYGRHQPRYLTPEVIQRLRARADRGAPPDFRSNVWPLIDREVRTVYYEVLVRERHGADRAAELLDAFLAAGDTDTVLVGDPLAIEESPDQRRVLDEYGIEPTERWDWRRIATPYHPGDLVSTRHYLAWLRSYVDIDVAEACKGNVDGPLKAAVDILRDLRNEIRLVVDHAGLSGDSYRDDLQGEFMALNAYLSIGPPVERIEQFGALLDAGVLHVLGPGLEVTRAPGGRFRARSRRIPDMSVRAKTLIEARMPEIRLDRTTDPLVRSLLSRGECRPYRIPIRGGGHYVTGGMAVSRRPYHLLDAADREHPCRFAFGVPTEAVHWVTAAGIRPGVNSVILSDADAIARACLRVAVDRLLRTPVPMSHLSTA